LQELLAQKADLRDICLRKEYLDVLQRVEGLEGEMQDTVEKKGKSLYD
jgi:hypothetical protein